MAGLSEETKLEIIKLLENVDVDGIDVQDILIRSGWNKQMLHQLIMCESLNDIEYGYAIRMELEQMENKLLH